MTGPKGKGLQLKVDNRNAIKNLRNDRMTKKRVLDENYKSSDIKRSAKRVKHEVKDTSKEDSEEALRLMSNDEIPEDYHEILSERRRIALEKSLDENARLCDEIKKLKEENEKLKELSEQADYFAKMLGDLLEKPEDDQEEEKSD